MATVDEEEGVRLPGGNVAGAYRVGDTVRRETGPWAPAVHALLDHLAARRTPCVPRVHGIDHRGREILDFLPGRIIDVDQDRLTDAQLIELTRFAVRLHRDTADFTHPGPWRFPGPPQASGIGHNDLAPYNVCFDGDRLTGVFDWDLAGPTTPVLELGMIAWTAVPLFTPDPIEKQAYRLQLIADTHGGITAHELIDATLERTRLAIEGITAAVAAGDPGMIHLAETAGEPTRMSLARQALIERCPQLRRALGRRGR
ncbi:aminoglycoside phosphotransferase [Enemella evansiae]|nr:aminoglycoside phosphotransferase [Enemella evansiae]OYO03649.1 aminoglycoside phosphotransferase [Enemella evansiae]